MFLEDFWNSISIILVIELETDNLIGESVFVKRRFLNQLALDLCTGGVSGTLATVPMTATMKLLHKYLVFYDQHNPPPKKITVRVARKLRISVPFFKKKKRKVMTTVSHYGYGAATGALYPLWSKEIPIHPLYKGMIHGLVVWSGSYLGLLPAMRLWSPKRESNARRITMITSHLVWGASLGLLHSKIPKMIKKSKKIANYDAMPQRA